LPEVPEDVWDRLLTATFEAPPGDDDLGLLPDADDAAPETELGWADDDLDPHDGTGHDLTADHDDAFDVTPLDEHPDQFDHGGHDF